MLHTTVTRKIMCGLRLLLPLATLVPLAACDEVLSLEVEAPGRLPDDNLNDRQAIPPLVAGMSFDLTQAIDGTLQNLNVASGDTWHGGSYDVGTYPGGNLLETPEDWDGDYGDMQQARWVAENGLERIATVLEPDEFNENEDVARAYLLAGFANRWIGEQQCASTIDGGPEVPYTEHFARADSLFSRGIEVAQAAGRQDLIDAAHGGRASIRAWLGDWAAAEADAAEVPVDFQYDAIFSTAVGAVNNDLVFETQTRREFSLVNSVWETVLDDPRVPWDIPRDAAGAIQRGQDGETLYYRQLKYLTEDDDIPLTKGTEMLVLRAEARLRDGDLTGMTERLNQARAFYGMDALEQPASVAEAWPVMRFERAATVWMEGRRLHDLRRWKEEGGVVADPFSENRDVCFPISDQERRTNPNL